jgi:putative oxidoreductase
MPSWRCLFAVPPRHGVEAFLLLIARIVAGVMFCVSGWNKVFTDAGRERMVHTLVSRPSALLLAAICAVAALTDGIARIPAGLSVPDWLSWFFYLSEVPLGVLLLWIAAVGSGRFAIEARWAR